MTLDDIDQSETDTFDLDPDDDDDTTRAYRFVFDLDSFHMGKVPGQDGDVYEITGYCKAKDIPVGVPSEVNPRMQNIEKPIYREVTASFLDKEDKSFPLKNKGIMPLASRVHVVSKSDNEVKVDVYIPPTLGNIDGHHTYLIVTKNASGNPDQYVPIRIRIGVPHDQVPAVAQSQNTSISVTLATMADYSGLFEEARRYLEPKPYFQWIKMRDNQPNVSADSKDLVFLMWVCNPFLFGVGTAKHPSWIYQRTTSVLEHGFYNAKDKNVRPSLLRMVEVLPELIESMIYINECAAKLIPVARKNQASGTRKPSQFTIRDLCEKKAISPFLDPADKTKKDQLREAYLFMAVSGLRNLLRSNEKTGMAEWSVDRDAVRSILNAAMPSVLKEMVESLKGEKGNHNKTSRQTALWATTESAVRIAFSQHMQNYAPFPPALRKH